MTDHEEDELTPEDWIELMQDIQDQKVEAFYTQAVGMLDQLAQQRTTAGKARVYSEWVLSNLAIDQPANAFWIQKSAPSIIWELMRLPWQHEQWTDATERMLETLITRVIAFMSKNDGVEFRIYADPQDSFLCEFYRRKRVWYFLFLRTKAKLVRRYFFDDFTNPDVSIFE